MASGAQAEIERLPDYAERALGLNALALLAPSRCAGLSFDKNGFRNHTDALYNRLSTDGYDQNSVAGFLLTPSGIAIGQQQALALLSKHGVDDVAHRGLCDAVQSEIAQSPDLADMIQTD